MTAPPLRRALVAEAVGTYLLVLFGTGGVAAAVLTGAQVGLWQVAVVWGFGVALAIYVSARHSGAHLNPAVTLAFALTRRGAFPRARVLPYCGAQLAGATVAAIFWPFVLRFEAREGLVRGQPGSERAAMVLGQYFPNPALFGTDAAAQALVSLPAATLVEAFGTAVLVFVIFALTDPDNRAAPGAKLAPFFVGFTVAVLISLFAPLTQAGWNPARDLGPRLVALALGWGAIAVPGPRWGFLAYLIGPLVGGPLGGWLYTALLETRPPTTAPAAPEPGAVNATRRGRAPRPGAETRRRRGSAADARPAPAPRRGRARPGLRLPRRCGAHRRQVGRP